MEENYLLEIKTAFVAAFTLITGFLGNLAMPVYLLVGMNVLDYITGLTAAPYRGEKRSSYRGFLGIFKKISMWLLVAVGAAVDWLLIYTAGVLGMASPMKCFVACCAAVWLVCNEILSILENISDIGVELPPFIRPLVEWVKERAAERKEVSGTNDQNQ